MCEDKRAFEASKKTLMTGTTLREQLDRQPEPEEVCGSGAMGCRESARSALARMITRKMKEVEELEALQRAIHWDNIPREEDERLYDFFLRQGR